MIETIALQPSETSTPTFSVLGIHLQFLAIPDQIRDDISILRSTVPPGAVIPLHSHPDPEIFYVLGGSLEIFQAINGREAWRKAETGETVSIAGGTKHAARNSSDQPAIALIVTKRELYSFLRELARPLRQTERPGPPGPEEMHALFAAANAYRYWLATPEENAAIGLTLARTEESRGEE